MMSQVAYQDGDSNIEKKLHDNGWQWKSYKMPSGLDYTVFTRIQNGKKDIVISFGGTQSGKDIIADIQQHLRIEPIAPQQYKDALDIADKSIRLKDIDAYTTLKFTGHSLGGGLAQYISLHRGVRAYVFNSAPLGLSTRWSLTMAESRQNAENNIINVRMRGDFVSASKPGFQYGLKIVYNMPSDASRWKQFSKNEGLHSMLPLIDAINEKRFFEIYVDKPGNGSIPGFWLDHTTSRYPGQLQKAYEILHFHAQKANKVLLAGKGSDVAKLYNTLIAEKGEQQVLWLTKVDNIREIQKNAQQFQADCILGAIEGGYTDFDDSQSILISRKAAENLGNVSYALAKCLHEMDFRSTADDKWLKSLLAPGDGAVIESFNKLQELYNLAIAVENDGNACLSGEFTLLNSSMLHLLAEKSFDDVIWPHFMKFLSENKVIKTPFKSDFGAKEFIQGIASNIKNGKLDIETITHYFDAINGLAWGALGYCASGNVEIAQAFQIFGVTMAKTYRDNSEAIFAAGLSLFSNSARLIMQNYQTELEKRISLNIAELPSLEEYVGGVDQLVKNGFSLANIEVAQQLQSLYEKKLCDLHPVKTILFDSKKNKSGANELVDFSALEELASDAQKVVLFGDDSAAESLYQKLLHKLGVGNVLWMHSDMDFYKRQGYARQFKADLIIRVKSGDSHREVDFNNDPDESDDDVKKYPASPPAPWWCWWCMPPPPAPVSSPNTDNTIRSGNQRAPFTNPHSGFKEQELFRTDKPTSAISKSSGIGGVMLHGTAIINQAALHNNADNFSLILNSWPGEIDIHQLRMFITALWAVYFGSEGPGISLDPIGPGIDKHMVRYIGNVINLDIGRVMREADYTMKKFVVGTDSAEIEGFKSPAQIAAEIGTIHVGASSRFWFVPESLRFIRTDNQMLFDSGQMTLKTEYAFSGDGTSSEENNKFAQYFTRNYTAISRIYPVFDELFEYAKMVSLAQYLKESNANLLWFLLANKGLILTEDSPGTVQELVHGLKEFEDVYVIGGVELEPKPGQYIFDADASKALRQAIADHIKDFPANTAIVGPISQKTKSNLSFSFDFGSDRYTVISQDSIIGGSNHKGFNYVTDLAIRTNGQPGLELIRFRNAKAAISEEFGMGWQLLVPYRIKPADSCQIQFRNIMLPRKMVLENQISEKVDTLHFSEDRCALVGYVPDDTTGNQVLGLFVMQDLSFRLADKLGNEFHFDQSGYLTEMALGETYQVRYEYADLPINNFDKTPYEIKTVDTERYTFGDISLPSRLMVCDSLNQEEEIFHLQHKSDELSYKPEMGQSSKYQKIVLMTDGAFRLYDIYGNKIEFNQIGMFEGIFPLEGKRLIKAMSKDNQRIEFHHLLGKANSILISTASLVNRENGDKPIRTVLYEYDQDCILTRVEKQAHK